MRIPDVMRNNNGPRYSPSIFKMFAKDWRFQHITSSTDYPRSNGLAEKTVQTMKNFFEKATGDNKDPQPTMLEARNTSAGNYRSPVKLEVGRKLRSVLPVNPNNLKIKQLMAMNSKKGEGKIRRNKASIMINSQRK